MPRCYEKSCREDSSRLSYYQCLECDSIFCERHVQPPYTDTGDFWKNIVSGAGAMFNGNRSGG